MPKQTFLNCRRRWLGVAALTALPALVLPVVTRAEQYPARMIRLIVPFPVGGASDVIARVLAGGLAEEFGQPVVVENKGGGGGTIGAREIARAKPDGYTLGIATISTHGIAPAVQQAPTYAVPEDFTPISLLTDFPGGILVHPSLGVRDYLGFIRFLKANPGRVNYGSSGTGGGTHIAMEFFKAEASVELNHVPYRGSGPAINDAVAGQVPVVWAEIPGTLQLIRAGKLIAIGVATKERIPQLPNTPTFVELGLSNYVADLWNGLVGPANLPQDVRLSLQSAVRRVMSKPEVRAKLEPLGARVRLLPGEDFGAFISAEVAKWTAVAQKAKIVVE